MAQFEVLTEENRSLKERCKTMADGLKPLMKALAPEDPEVTDPVNAPEAIMEQCKKAWPVFKDFIRDAGQYVAASVLALVWSHYPLVNLKRIEEGVAADTGEAEANELRNSSWETAARVMQDIKLIDEGSSSHSA